jgi:hypothetical protein
MDYKYFLKLFCFVTLITTVFFACAKEEETTSTTSSDNDSGTTASLALPFDFETSPTASDFYDFDGGQLTIADNPNSSGINTSSKVAKMIKGCGDSAQNWGGSYATLTSAIDFSTNKSFTMDVFVPAVGTKVLFKLENAGDNTIASQVELDSSVANSWEELTFNFSSIDNQSYQKIVIIFDQTDKGSCNSATYTYYFDNIEQVATTADNSSSSDSSRSFIGGNLLSDGDFEKQNNPEVWIDNAGLNIVDNGSNYINEVDVASAVLAHEVNISHKVSITDNITYQFGFSARSDDNRSMIAGIGLNKSPWTNQSVTTTLSSEWKDYRYLLTSNFGDNDSRVLFDMGAAVGQVQLDNVSLYENHINDGNFEDNSSLWTGSAKNIVDNGSNLINSYNVTVAGLPHTANLSHVTPLVQNDNYTLSFHARSDGNRKILVGIGLSDSPWTSVVDNVSLSSNWELHSLDLDWSADNASGRIIFDMGAETGLVLLDNVSLIKK